LKNSELSQKTDGAIFHPCPPDPACPYCNGSITSDKALDWSFLDGVYCISLKIRDDRAQSVAKEFHQTGLCQKVTFYRPEKHPEHGIIGSWESHRAVGVDALHKHLERTLICEDDVVFSRNLRPSKLKAIKRAVEELPSDWMIFYLGHWPLWAYFVKHNVLRTSSACAHAYIISPRLAKWLNEHPWGAQGIEKRDLVGRALDAYYAKLPGVFALFPMIATQSVSVSDNFNYKPKKIKKLKHVVTHSKHRDLLLSKLMRPFEFIVVALSPVFYIYQTLKNIFTRNKQASV
jgi:GR25 family glycosyltransferase involved in LPS biosynthesis